MANKRGAPLMFHAVQQAMRCMQPVYGRNEFKVAEVRAYLLEHWDALLPGWPKPRELTGNASDKPLTKINCYFTKHPECFAQRSGPGWLGAPYWTLASEGAPVPAAPLSVELLSMELLEDEWACSLLQGQLPSVPYQNWELLPPLPAMELEELEALD